MGPVPGAQSAENMMEIIEKFDFDKDGDLDNNERAMLVSFSKYFAGDDKELDSKEIEAMSKLLIDGATQCSRPGRASGRWMTSIS